MPRVLWLQSDRVVLLMMGSSNFTSAGLGIGVTQNLEANLAYAVSQQSKKSPRRCLTHGSLSKTYLKRSNYAGCPASTMERTRPPPESSYFRFFLDRQPSAVTNGRDGFVELTFNGTPPKGWAIYLEDESEPFLNEGSWRGQDCPVLLRLAWESDRAPSGFRVNWRGSGSCAWWPVNILTSAALPPPAELKDLSLDVLIEILTSAKPLYQTLERWLRRRKQDKIHEEGISLDPHKRVDTSSFLLQRTRRVSDALTGLRQRLERPVVSQQALEWRIRGPVGVMALAQAVGKEARSEQERCFPLTELCFGVGSGATARISRQS